MSFQYSAYEGSFDDLRHAFRAVRLDPEADDALEHRDELLEHLDDLIEAGWRPVRTDLLGEIDWHELDDVVAVAQRRIPSVAGLLHGLFVDPPLEISPDGPGWSGSLTAAERVSLQAALEDALGGEEVDTAARGNRSGVETATELQAAELALSYVLLTLRGVTAGHDIVVALG